MSEAYTYYARNHRTWGDSIAIDDWMSGRIHGWLPRLPRVGERIVFELRSGKQQATVITSIRFPGDPPDMFFAIVRKEGEDEQTLQARTEQRETIWRRARRLFTHSSTV